MTQNEKGIGTLGIIVVVVLTVLGVAGAIFILGNDSPTSRKVNSNPVEEDYKLDGEIQTSSGETYLSTTFEGPEDSYNVKLLNPEGVKTDEEDIPESDMSDGKETIELSITSQEDSPSEGTYTVQVFKNGELVFSKDFEVTITS